MKQALLTSGTDFDAWRTRARALLATKTPPYEVIWRIGEERDLFGEEVVAQGAAGAAPRAFLDLAQTIILHDDPERFALLYRLLWRLQTQRALLDDPADPDVAKARLMEKAIRRDIHKMRAFVRFRSIPGGDGEERFVSWFEPRFPILRATADFFVNRFTGMHWSIITPFERAAWDGARLAFGPGGRKSDVPPEDAQDETWRAYYESMFNPARLMVDAMTKEMPKRYWRNLPEAQSIPGLVRAAHDRTADMVASEPTMPKKRAGAAHAALVNDEAARSPIAARAVAPTSIEDLSAALAGCRACPLWENATQAVPGAGPAASPHLLLVGEQPGDQEDLAGRAFVGPAGQVLDRALADAGIDRATVYVTNAVKHFKWTPRGKRRLHQKPNTGEIETCRWWVAHEIALVRPRLVVALGATALASLSDVRGSLNLARGRLLSTREGAPLMATYHPSAILRVPDEAAKAEAYAALVTDLRAAAAWSERS